MDERWLVFFILLGLIALGIVLPSLRLTRANAAAGIRPRSTAAAPTSPTGTASSATQAGARSMAGWGERWCSHTTRWGIRSRAAPAA